MKILDQTYKTYSTTELIIALIFVISSPLCDINTPVAAISWGELLLAIDCVLIFCSVDLRHFSIGKIQINMCIVYILFLIISFCCMIIRARYDLAASVIRIIRWGFYIGAAVLISCSLNFDLLKRIMIGFTVAASIVLIVQNLLYLTLGQILAVTINGTSIGASFEGIYSSSGYDSTIIRFSSFYSEPAHFAYSSNVGLALLLFYRKVFHFSKTEIFEIGLIFVATILSTSTYGMLLLAIQGCYLFWQLIKGRSNRVIIILFAVIIVALLAAIINHSQYGTYILYKLSTLSSRERFQFVWNSLKDQSLIEKFFGVGIGNEEFYYASIQNTQIPYLNSVSMTYLYCGWAGVLIIIGYFVAALADKARPKIMLILFFAVSLFSTSFYSTPMILMTALYTLGENTDTWVTHKDRNL